MNLEAITQIPEADAFLHRRSAGLWQYPGFNVLAELSSRNPIIEIGGPTPRGYQLIGKASLRRLLVSNVSQKAVERIKEETPIWRRIITRPAIDFAADAFALPFREESIGAVFVSAFWDGPFYTADNEDIGYRAPMIDEVERVLQPRGLFIMQYGNIRNLRRMADNKVRPRLLKVNELKDMKAVPPLDEHVLWSHTRSLFIAQKDTG